MKNITPETADIIMMLDAAMVEVITRNEKPKSLYNARKKAIEQTAGQICIYIDDYYDVKIIETICRKKIDAIMLAKTAQELDEIVHSPKPTHNGGQLVDHPKYQFDEEELLNWCRASLKYPPGPAVAKRVNELFQRIYGMSVDDYTKRNLSPS